MLFGAAGQAFSMAVLAGSSAYLQYTACGIVAAIFLFVFNTFFAIGWLGMTWYVAILESMLTITDFNARLYPAEVTPLSIRAPANAISTTANWIFNFVSQIQLFYLLGHEGRANFPRSSRWSLW